MSTLDARTQTTFVAAGLMSGTSMDGIDGTLLITDGQGLIKDLGSYSIEYQPEFKLLLKSCEVAVVESEGSLKKARHDYEKILKALFSTQSSHSC